MNTNQQNNGTQEKQFGGHYPVIIIGGGQAGLSMSYCLKERRIEHLVFEKSRLGESWRSQRWDSFCLVTPNWQCQLPGFPYSGNEPDGFMKKDEIVAYIEAYAESFKPPIREGVNVSRLSQDELGRFVIATSIGDYLGDQVVVATGGYQLPSVPRMAERFPENVSQLLSCDYKCPESVAAGGVLVVGSGQSGCQIAEDLHIAGRRVHLCVGGAPRTARRYRGRDVVAWLDEMGYYNKPIHEHPLKERVRAKANHYVTGRDGGRDIDLRKLATEGMQLYGRLKDVTGSLLRFANDLKQNLDQADAVAESIKTTIDKFIESRGVDVPIEERYRPVWEPSEPVLELDYIAADIRTAIWSVGYRTDYSWIEVPIFDGKGYPAHQRGVTTVPGLYFLGLPWQYTWGSGRFSGVARDARFLAEYMEARSRVPVPEPARLLNELALGS